MDSTPPLPTGPGQRMLAAIVFTDTVSFSARMQEDETATLALLERDFAVMRSLCEKHEGSVLKTTGDGLLLYFSSAVLAVAYAQKMQRHFAEAARGQAPDDFLLHRVGVHLGDVFVNNDDVMGDGVNIAARLQAVAEPGGICISQTVYDVVKNKLDLDVVKLGPRELKNISDPMSIYRVLLEPPKRTAATTGLPGRSFTPAPAAAVPFFTKTQKLMVVLVLAAALGLGGYLLMDAQRKHEEELARSHDAGLKIDALLARQKSAAQPATAPGTPGAPDDSSAADPAVAEAYSFAAMIRRQPAPKDGPARTDEWMRQQAAQRLPALFEWLNTAMQRYSKDDPLVAHEKTGTITKEIKVFTGADHRTYFTEGGAIRQRNWTNLSPGTTGAIVVDALDDAPGTVPPAIVEGAEAFAYFYSLPAMNEELRKLRVRRGQR